MIPSLYAIFVICSMNLLECEYLTSWTREFGQDLDQCQEYVLKNTLPNPRVLGKCVWRIVTK